MICTYGGFICAYGDILIITYQWFASGNYVVSVVSVVSVVPVWGHNDLYLRAVYLRRPCGDILTSGLFVVTMWYLR